MVSATIGMAIASYGTPVSAAEFIHGRIAFSQLEIISEAAHFVHVEKAGVFNEVRLEFLEAISK